MELESEAITRALEREGAALSVMLGYHLQKDSHHPFMTCQSMPLDLYI